MLPGTYQCSESVNRTIVYLVYQVTDFQENRERQFTSSQVVAIGTLIRNRMAEQRRCIPSALFSHVIVRLCPLHA